MQVWFNIEERQFNEREKLALQFLKHKGNLSMEYQKWDCSLCS